MTAKEMAQHVNARPAGKGRWETRCPAHGGKKLSLKITAGEKAVLLQCWSRGCDPADIVKAMGLTMSDLFYESRTRQTPKERARLERERIQAEAFEYRGRIRNWIILFKNEGYKDREGDLQTSIACAIMLSGGYDKEHIRRMLRNALERLTAESIMRMADDRRR